MPCRHLRPEPDTQLEQLRPADAQPKTPLLPDQHPTAVDSVSHQACDLAAPLEPCSRPGHYLVKLARIGPLNETAGNLADYRIFRFFGTSPSMTRAHR